MTRGCALSQLLCYHRFCVWKTLQPFWPGGGEGKSHQEREVGWGKRRPFALISMSASSKL